MGRALVVIAGATTVVLSTVSLVLLSVAYVDHRREDFVTATVTEDMTSLGTCITTASAEAVEGQAWFKEDWDCARSLRERRRLAVLLAASVHTLYHTQRTSKSPSSALAHVTHAAVAATMGDASEYSLNATLAAEALKEVARAALPRRCSDIYNDTAAGELPSPTPVTIDCGYGKLGLAVPIDDAVKRRLLAHCQVQFSFGMSGPAKGSASIPVFGETPGPRGTWIKPSNFSQATPNTKARLFLGYRFQWAVPAYLILALTLSFCLVDGILVLTAEVTVDCRSSDVHNQHVSDDPSVLGVMTTMAATYTAKRQRRGAILFFLVVFTGVALLVYVWLPWDFGQRLGRPVCPADDDEGVFGMASSTRGGWAPDQDAVVLELLCFGWTVVALFLIMAARYLEEGVCCKALQQDSVSPATTPDETQRVAVNENSLRVGAYQAVAFSATIVLFIAYVLPGRIFSSAWTDAVMQKDVEWTESRVSDIVYNHATNGILVMAASGMTVAAIQGRWLIDGMGCSATLTVFAWTLVALLPFLILLVTMGSETFSDSSESTKECKVFKDGFSSDVCLVKWVMLVAGTGTLLAVIVFASVTSMFRRFRQLESNRRVPPDTLFSSFSSSCGGSMYAEEKLGLLPAERLKKWRLPIRFHDPREL